MALVFLKPNEKRKDKISTKYIGSIVERLEVRGFEPRVNNF